MKKNSSNILLRGSWETSASIIKYINGVKTFIKTNPKTLKSFNRRKSNYKTAFFNDIYKNSLINHKSNKNEIFLTRNKSAYINRKKTNFIMTNLKINRINLKLFNFHIIKNRTETEKIFNIQDIEKEFEERYKFLKKFTNYFRTSNSNINETVKNEKNQKVPKRNSDFPNSIQYLNKTKKQTKYFSSIDIIKSKKILEKNSFDNNNKEEKNDIKNLLIKNDLKINNNKPTRPISTIDLKFHKNMLIFQILANLHTNQNNITNISIAEIRKHNNIITRNKIKEAFKDINKNKINNNNIISSKEINNFLNIRQIPVNFKIKNKRTKSKIKYHKEIEKHHSVDEIIYRSGNSFENTERENNNFINNSNSYLKNNNHSFFCIKKSNKTFDKACNADLNFLELEQNNENTNKINKELLNKRKKQIH